MTDLFRTPIKTPGDCDACGNTLNVYEDPNGSETVWCGNCNPTNVSDLSTGAQYECRGCGEVRPDCVAHHTSYDPEHVVPMCRNCHARLHGDESFLPELSPDMTRLEAESRDLVSIIGLDDSWVVVEADPDCSKQG